MNRMNNFGQGNTVNHIYFCRKSDKNHFMYNSRNKKDDNENSQQSIFLLSTLCNFHIFEAMPKTFTISTKNNSCHFNIELLKDTSPVISNFLKENPDNLQYFLNINDEENALSKFEQLYNGEIVTFDEDELPSCQRITKILQIKNCPNYLKPESLRDNEIDSISYYTNNTKFNDSILTVEIYQSSFKIYLKNEDLKTFTIITNKKEYKCNIFGIRSSKIIQEILEKNPDSNQFVYDFEDEYDEFQLICDIFNFKSVGITSNNMDSLKEIAEDLQIFPILNQIDNYINNYEKFSQKVDEQQTIIDSIDQLFDWLYNIKILTVETVKISIVQSKWVESEESVQELAAFILQVIKVDFRLHQEMADLLIQLNEESNQTNSLNILIPFIVQNLIDFYMPKSIVNLHPQPSISSSSSSMNDYNQSNKVNTNLTTTDENTPSCYSFIRILYKRGIISKEKIIEKLKNYKYQNKYIDAFFLPELIELDKSVINILISRTDNNNNNINNNINNVVQKSNSNDVYNFINNYLPDKIDLYKKMLDNMEPDDELTKSLRRDDVDTLQSIITRNQVDISKAYVPYNIFDNFDNFLNYINYAALYGSIKCFKYLLLNNGEVDLETLYFAVYGGNTEIIKIVDQRCSDANYLNSRKKANSLKLFNIYNNNQNYKIVNGIIRFYTNYGDDNNVINPSITKHRNDLFDWIFEKNFVCKGKIGNSLSNIALSSASNGNAHSLVEIIDKGFDVSSNSFLNVIQESSKNGFYKLTQLLLKLVDKKAKKNSNKNINILNTFTFDFQSIVKFGNLSIFKLFIKQMNQNNLETSILYSIELNHINILDYFFDNLVNKNFTLTESFISSSLNMSLWKRTDLVFNYLIEKFKKLNPNVFNLDLYSVLIAVSCMHQNISATKTITDLILKENPNYEFSSAFVMASCSNSLDICKYFIDKKIFIDYERLSLQVSELGSVDVEIFSTILYNVKPEIKKKFLHCIKHAIQKKNKNLVEFLLKEKDAPHKFALIEAVSIRDLEIVNLILNYDNRPSFINRRNEKGTALLISVKNGDYSIVKRLLSIPGIDPSLGNQFNEYPITVAIKNTNFEIIDAILNFYGDDIQLNVWMYNEIMQSVSKFFSIGHLPERKMWNILKRILRIKSIDPNYNDSFLYKACHNNDIEMVDFLLKLDKIDVNKHYYQNGNTPFMAAVMNNHINLVKLLIEFPKTNINFRNYNNETALTIAVTKKHKEIINLLINDKRFEPKESRLNFAFYSANKEISELLLKSKYLDVNYVFDKSRQEQEENDNYSIFYLRFDDDSIKETSLTSSVNNLDIEKIDMIIGHPTFDKDKSKINKAIFTSVKKNNISIFRKLFSLVNYDVNISNKNENLLKVAAGCSNIEILKEIFNNPKFDPKNDQIIYAFVKSYESRSDEFTYCNSIIETMNFILDYDKQHENLIDFKKLLPNGESYFTTIFNDYDNIDDVCNFLLDHGVDPNKPNKNGYYPLESAIEISSLKFVITLINSNKIDFSKKIRNRTYLHVAASCEDSAILKELLDRNLIDINATDNKGQTALMEACEFGCYENVVLFLDKENIDYLHRNNKGKDALKLVGHVSQSDYDDAIKSKDNYRKKIIRMMKKSMDLMMDENENDFDEEEQNFVMSSDFEESIDESSDKSSSYSDDDDNDDDN